VSQVLISMQVVAQTTNAQPILVGRAPPRDMPDEPRPGCILIVNRPEEPQGWTIPIAGGR
jgi:hypothetical protein